MKKNTLSIVATAALITILCVCFMTGCNGGHPDKGGVMPPIGLPNLDSAYSEGEVGDIIENPVISTDVQNDIYLSLDPHTANYTLMKDFIKKGRSIESIRNVISIDHMLNYFDHDLPSPQDDELLAMKASVFDCPYNESKKLLSIGLKAKEVETKTLANNIVMLLDVSGSMSGDDKIELMKKSMILMAENLNPDDTLSIVTYSNKTRTVLDGARIGDNMNKIKRAINDLRADGGTNGSDGIQTAYEVAKSHFINDGNNRVILASDGDFNIGISDVGELKEFISEKRDGGIYLTCIGLGNIGDYSISTMEALARSGNGYWGFIRNMDDARKMLVEDLSSSIITVARDVKAKIKFSTETVKNFRLLGFERSILSENDYEENDTDAGELGSNFEMIVCFEIELKEGVDVSADEAITLAQIDIRYKSPQATSEDESQELNLPISSDVYSAEPSDNDMFVSGVIEFALVALNSKYKAQADIDDVIVRLQILPAEDKYKLEFLELVKTYKDLLNNIPTK